MNAHKTECHWHSRIASFLFKFQPNGSSYIFFCYAQHRSICYRQTRHITRLISNASAYYNPRLYPKNFLDRPLSMKSDYRLRQMLARRPSIVSFILKLIVDQVAPGICDGISARCAIEADFNCLYQKCQTVSHIFVFTDYLSSSGVATTASRLASPI